MLPSLTVAIINDNADTLATLREVLEREHYHVVTSRTRDAHGVETDFVTFMTEHDPRVVVWDIAVPYARQWARFSLVRSTGALAGRTVVLTTTHKGHFGRPARDGLRSVRSRWEAVRLSAHRGRGEACGIPGGPYVARASVGNGLGLTPQARGERFSQRNVVTIGVGDHHDFRDRTQCPL
jgi:CheY-like chemotaxis protein